MTSDADLLKRKANTIVEKDYLDNMFQEGENRTATESEIKSAPGYDQAVRTNDTESPNADVITPDAVSVDTFHSRDGTDSVGIFDESDGPLGGTEKELDDLEASGTPVDRNPHMKD